MREYEYPNRSFSRFLLITGYPKKVSARFGPEHTSTHALAELTRLELTSHELLPFQTDTLGCHQTWQAGKSAQFIGGSIGQLPMNIYK